MSNYAVRLSIEVVKGEASMTSYFKEIEADNPVEAVTIAMSRTNEYIPAGSTVVGVDCFKQNPVANCGCGPFEAPI